MKIFLNKIYNRAVTLNRINVNNLLENNPKGNFLDLGCDDGKLTFQMAELIGTGSVYGVEIVDERIKLAKEKGVRVKKFNLNDKFGFDDNFFDVVHANQVIEHLHDSDSFLSEIHRILKPDGYAIISTENGSSWCNIFAALMGWQIFSLTNITSKKLGVGNPFALHRNDEINFESWNHVRIYNIRGLKELLEAHGFKVEKIKGSGYFPLPAKLGDIDKTHCHYMTFKVRKI